MNILKAKYQLIGKDVRRGGQQATINEEKESDRMLSPDGEDDGSSCDSDTTLGIHTAWGNMDRRTGRKASFNTSACLLVSLLVTTLSAIGLLIWIVLLLKSQRLADVEDLKTKSFSVSLSACGSSAEEARAADCYFDIFSFGWTPRECQDVELYNQSLAVLHKQLDGLPSFFTGSDGHYSPLSLSDIESWAIDHSAGQAVLANGRQVFGTWEHYLTACTYAWQKVQRAAMRNWPIEQWSSSYALADRCGPDLLRREKHESGSVMWSLQPWFPRCGLTSDDIKKEILEVEASKGLL